MWVKQTEAEPEGLLKRQRSSRSKAPASLHGFYTSAACSQQGPHINEGTIVNQTVCPLGEGSRSQQEASAKIKLAEHVTTIITKTHFCFHYLQQGLAAATFPLPPCLNTHLEDRHE